MYTAWMNGRAIATGPEAKVIRAATTRFRKMIDPTCPILITLGPNHAFVRLVTLRKG